MVASHPIQYQAPWFRALARDLDLQVFFCHRQTPQGQADAGFGQPFDWDVPLLDGYAFEWLPNRSTSPGVETYGGCDTPDIAGRLAAGRFDACLVNGWYLKSYVQAIRAGWRLGIPVLVRGDSQLRGPRSLLRSTAKYLPYRWFLRRVDAHLYVGRANREYLEHYGVRPSQLFFVPHFVDNERFTARADTARRSGEAAALRARWQAPDGTPVFLFAGKLIEKKRPGDFLSAIGALQRPGSQVRGVFVGSGPLEAMLRQRAVDESLPIHFMGFQNQSAIAACYAAADCLVLPSDGRETWGLVVNEAMAAGLPAIVSDEVGCAPDLVIDGRTGFTFPVGDVEALTERMGAMSRTLSADRPGLTAAVAGRIAEYSCAAAVRGTLAAVAAVTNRAAAVAGQAPRKARHET